MLRMHQGKNFGKSTSFIKMHLSRVHLYNCLQLPQPLCGTDITFVAYSYIPAQSVLSQNIKFIKNGEDTTTVSGLHSPYMITCDGLKV